jgi:hypothetical protein
LSPQRLIERYAGFPSLVWAGPGARLHWALLQDYAEQNANSFGKPVSESLAAQQSWSLAREAENLAGHTATLALRRFSANQLETAESLRAIYVRPSDAEINQPCR